MKRGPAQTDCTARRTNAREEMAAHPVIGWAALILGTFHRAQERIGFARWCAGHFHHLAQRRVRVTR